MRLSPNRVAKFIILSRLLESEDFVVRNSEGTEFEIVHEDGAPVVYVAGRKLKPQEFQRHYYRQVRAIKDRILGKDPSWLTELDNLCRVTTRKQETDND